jgi:hypothetical protein
MTADSCRWHEDPNGRCADPLMFPGVEEVPELCARHLGQLEPWIRRRVATRQSDGEAWIQWAARRASEADDDLKTTGIMRGDRRPRPEPPERR